MPSRRWWRFWRSLPTVFWWLVMAVILVGSTILAAINP